ncbi:MULTISPECIES: hypothetical protein [Mycobacteroides]|uniref:hypothetical protein n=1 Tax=Mycobacteroides TaxID=670516 RepID=UPI000714EB88|nr:MULTISPECIES: hypothetical protein [Mycobacteroides]KRQ20589.1 hypothetical protein AOT87_17775 [Mycobacteroides sp. H003]KRQ20983.1 hypothetical protein AOT91_26535 [Mycobacteroides sp. H092]KRQ35401.1 hypothetical protein AOT92_24195 [Mycobacteroides sp. H101]KRQ45675.1 hypothetical protein AOT88_19685 [Mycobacteroides sp. H063]KRQ55460.1 hypothetical protein AOT90_28110 [Mycobacteroides sp. H079]
MRIPAAMVSLCRDSMLHKAHTRAGELIFEELRTSRRNFPKLLDSRAEAVSVLEEEIDELRDAVRANIIEHARAEAVQVGAMALRLIIDGEGRQPSEARDRLAVQSAVARAANSDPLNPLVSAHEGKGYLRGRHEQLLAGLVADNDGQVIKAANALAVLALRFVAEVPAEAARHQVGGLR